MVTKHNQKAKPEVKFIRHLTSLGRERKRWCIMIPPDIARVINTQKVYEVTISPIGTISP